MNYSEATLRDLIVSNLNLIETGLSLIDKEHYLPNEIGTKGFIDILAKDQEGHLVVIEVKKSDSTSREALHEVFKYLEGIKINKGLKNEEIRLLIISSNWKELLVPFSSAYHNSGINLEGYLIIINDACSITSIQSIEPVRLNNDRMFCDHHMLRAYISEENLEKGISDHLKSFQTKGIDDYVLVLLVAPVGHREKELQAMEVNLSGAIDNPKSLTDAIANIRSKYPDYGFIIYSATQLQAEPKYWEIIKTDQDTFDEVIEIIDDYIDEDRLETLHDYAIDVVSPVPHCDTSQIGYASKLQNYTQDQGWTVRKIIRGNRFNNEFLDDTTILEELMGSQGTTKQKYSREFNSQNRSSLLNMRKEVTYCLEDNKQWQVPIINIIDNLLSIVDKEQFKGKIYIYNPMHILYTIYLMVSQGEVIQWAPNFYILVEYKDHTTMYFGGLKRSGVVLPWNKIIKKHFEADLSDLAISLTWGGYMHNDLDLVNDLGLAYGIYCLDKADKEDNFMEYINYDFRPSIKTDPFIGIMQYLEEETEVVENIVVAFEEFFPNNGWTFI